LLGGGYTLFMELPNTVDLTKFSFGEFISFLFGHEVPTKSEKDDPESEKYDPWYFHVQVEFDAKTICAYYVRLFRQPEFLLSRFTKPQLEEGFWAIQGPNLDRISNNRRLGPAVARPSRVHRFHARVVRAPLR
jgi:hypothetical protein